MRQYGGPKFGAYLHGGFAAAWTFEASAQRTDQKRLVVVLQDLAQNEPVAQSEVTAFRETLAKFGWTEGNNVQIEVGWGAGARAIPIEYRNWRKYWSV